MRILDRATTDNSIFDEIGDRFSKADNLASQLGSALSSPIKALDTKPAKVTVKNRSIVFDSCDVLEAHRVLGSIASVKYRRVKKRLPKAKPDIYDYHVEHTNSEFQQAFITRFDEATQIFTKLIANQLAIESALSSVAEALDQQDATKGLDLSRIFATVNRLGDFSLAKQLANYMQIPETLAFDLLTKREGRDTK